MRKLLLLPAVGAAAALTYGAAAALNVSGTQGALQVGVVDDLQCAEGANIAGWGYDDTLVSAFYVWIDVTDVNANCDGYSLYATPLNAAGQPLTLLGSNGYATGRVTLGVDGTDRVDDVTRYQVQFGTNGAGPGSISATQVEQLRISIDPGPNVDGTL